jgi:NAD(P)-dependent dehydrogenase (short-subunit alcohol dehydrogenase family)
MSSVVVLGGTGFVGPYIVSQLVNRGDDVVLFHRGHREPPLTKGAEHVHGEFERLSEYIAELSRREPDVVIDVSPGLGKGGHGAMSVLWGVEDAVQGMPVTEDSELRTGPSP